MEEIQHYYDRCNGLGDNCDEKACLELRGKTFAGECANGNNRKENESEEDCLKSSIRRSIEIIAQFKGKNIAQSIDHAMSNPNCRLDQFVDEKDNK